MASYIPGLGPEIDIDEGNLLDELASIAEVDGVVDQREKLCLWVLRNRYGVDPADSFEYVFSPPARIKLESEAREIDGLVVSLDGQIPVFTLLFYIDANSDDPIPLARINDIEARVNVMARDLATLYSSLAKTNRRTREIVLRSQVTSSVIPQIEWRLVIITPGIVSNTNAQKLAKANQHGIGIEVLDIQALRTHARAVANPETMPIEIVIPKKSGRWIYTTQGHAPVLMTPMKGKELISWGGINDRRLFDLNVRFGLGMNRVRRSLNEALMNEDQREFLAGHNGITIVCDEIKEEDETFVIKGASIVNGAQSIIALYDNASALSDELYLFVKFVGVGSNKDEASKIAVRSNTQNPVTSRNLRALDRKQLSLQRELAEIQYNYMLRPDTSVRSRDLIIRNDDAAQWLCGLYLEEPALAVKRQELFAPGTYDRVFNEDIHGVHVALAHQLHEAIQTTRSNYPQPYQRSWSLVALTALYLSGQILRNSEAGYSVLFKPEGIKLRNGDYKELLSKVAGRICKYLSMRHNRLIADESLTDNFKVDFKSMRKLNEMRLEVRRFASDGANVR